MKKYLIIGALLSMSLGALAESFDGWPPGNAVVIEMADFSAVGTAVVVDGYAFEYSAAESILSVVAGFVDRGAATLNRDRLENYQRVRKADYLQNYTYGNHTSDYSKEYFTKYCPRE